MAKQWNKRRRGRQERALDNVRDEVEQAAAYLTGTAGPGRWAFERGRRWGLGERIIKSALAAAIAWFLATTFFDHGRPILAPLTAIFAIQVTIAQSFMGTAQRFLGLAAGIVVAFFVELFVGPSSLAIGLGVLIALVIGVRLRLDTIAVTQLATTAVVGIAGGDVDPHWRYLSTLAIDTALGAAVGVALNLLIAPPTHIQPALASLSRLADELGEIYRKTGRMLAEGLTAGETRDQLERARRSVTLVAASMAAVERAEESLRYTIVPDDRRRALERARRMTRALEHAAIQSRIIHRSLSDAIGQTPDVMKTGWLQPDAVGAPLGRLLESAGEAVVTLGAIPSYPEEISTISVRLNSLRSAHEQAVAAARERSDLLASGDWVIAGEVLGAAAQLLGDLELAAM